jgi:hypothetical protein
MAKEKEKASKASSSEDEVGSGPRMTPVSSTRGEEAAIDPSSVDDGTPKVS